MSQQTVDAVRSRIAERRDRGELPAVPEGELQRQFDGVVEGVEAGLLGMPPLDLNGVRRSVGEMPARPVGGRKALGAWYVDRLLRAVVRRFPSDDINANEFARSAAPIVEELADRQRRMQDLVMRVQLDRIRDLEYRISVLEMELERRSGEDPTGDA